MNAATETPASETATPAPRVPQKGYLVAVLYYGAVDREHDKCVRALNGHPLVANTMELTGCPYIDIGRGIAATAVLDSDQYGGILFIDHDMVFDPAEAIATIQSAIDADATVGAAYSMRKSGAIIGAIDGSKLPEGRNICFFDGGEVLPANYLGMGMTAIPRSVLVRLVEASQQKHARQLDLVAQLRHILRHVTAAVAPDGEPLDASKALDLFEQLVPELRDEDLPRLKTGISDAIVVPFFSLLQRQGYYYGEDVSFCARSHFAGLGVFVDTRRRVYHKGSYCYGIEDVGIEVPYCHRLEVVNKNDPTVAPSLFSKSPAVREALEAQHAERERALSDDSPEAPLASYDAEPSYPRSYDPTELPAVGAEAP